MLGNAYPPLHSQWRRCLTSKRFKIRKSCQLTTNRKSGLLNRLVTPFQVHDAPYQTFSQKYRKSTKYWDFDAKFPINRKSGSLNRLVRLFPVYDAPWWTFSQKYRNKRNLAILTPNSPFMGNRCRWIHSVADLEGGCRDASPPPAWYRLSDAIFKRNIQQCQHHYFKCKKFDLLWNYDWNFTILSRWIPSNLPSAAMQPTV
jgi:hypothetical protein